MYFDITINYAKRLKIISFSEPYTGREARIHVRHTHNLLKSMTTDDSYSGIECSSLSFLSAVTNGDVLGECNKDHIQVIYNNCI